MTDPRLFRCAACHQSKPVTGRRMRFLHGLRRYVCATCRSPKS